MAQINLRIRTTSRKTSLYNFDSLKPHFYIVKLGFTGVHIIFLISAQKKKKIVVLVRTASPMAVLTGTHNSCFGQKYEKYQNFCIGKFSFFVGNFFFFFFFFFFFQYI